MGDGLRVPRRLLERVIVAAFAFALGSATLVFSAGLIPDSSGRIWACYNNTNGQARIVTDSSECRNNETSISWSQTGPAGGTGPQGASGVPGASGQPGASAAAGPSGASGATGASGASGATGPSGAAGP